MERKKPKLRWNFVASIAMAAYGVFLEVYSAVVLLGGSISMVGDSHDIMRVMGAFGLIGSIGLLIVEGVAIIVVVMFLSLVLWGIDRLFCKLLKKDT